MKNKILIFIFISIQTISFARDAEKSFGLGIILGEPTGISFKVWQNERTAYDAALAWSFKKKGSLHAHVDYLFHNYKVINLSKAKFPFYFGIGGRLKSEEEFELGVRIPFGVNYLFSKLPVDVFLELVPALNLIPKTELDMEGGIGARYYF